MNDLTVPAPQLGEADYRLRAWRSDDADAVFTACQDPDIQRFIPVPVPYLLEHAREFVAQGPAYLAEGRGIALAVADPATDAAIGSVTLHATMPRRWFIGYWMAPDARGRGIASRAVRRLATWGLARHSLARLSLYTLDNNVASQRVAEKAGFTREGTLRNWDEHRGESRDCVMFSLVPSDLES